MMAVLKRGDADVNKSPRTIGTAAAMKSSFKTVAEKKGELLEVSVKRAEQFFALHW